MAEPSKEDGGGSQQANKASEQLKESAASLPSLSTLDPAKGDGVLSWLRSMNFGPLTKRFCENYGL